jgi:hypothetical protein
VPPNGAASYATASKGVNYNITHNQWSGNVSAWSVDKSGWTFNPSVSAMILPERTTNLIRRQRFRNNDQVLANFVANKQYQRALNYFGFKGKYDPTNDLFKLEGAGDAIFHPKSNGIYYRNNAFQHGYDYLYAAYMEEQFHSTDYLIAASKAPSEVFDLHNYEEWRAQMYLYKNQGLYPNSGNNWVQRINYYGIQSGLYSPSVFNSKWWHSIYKIPRRW